VVAIEAGADMVAPSGMMDGQVAAIRAALDEAGHTHAPIMAYSSTMASAFYGSFRAAAGSELKGDRKAYQMNPLNGREAIRESLLDEEEGADILMVKPALAYLDIIAGFRQRTLLPIAAYQVSGEYAMIKFAAGAGALDEGNIVRETLGAIKRAGADLILTLFCPRRNPAGILASRYAAGAAFTVKRFVEDGWHILTISRQRFAENCPWQAGATTTSSSISPISPTSLARYPIFAGGCPTANCTRSSTMRRSRQRPAPGAGSARSIPS
jgi:hypothetical protein